jgi:hypothetical protein
VKVYAGLDPLTGREIRLRRTCKTERAAQIELGKLLEQADAGRQPETGATVAELMDKYAQVADWDLSTRVSNDGYIRRVIKPALGHLQVRKVRGPVLDLLYARLKRCADPLCAGKPFIEHRNVPDLSVDPAGGRPARRQVADAISDAIGSGALAPGDPLPSVRELSALQGVRTATLQHALSTLAAEGLVLIRQGRTAVVLGEAAAGAGRAPRRPGRGHDCKRSRCGAHVCKPMKATTIRNVHHVLSGAFAAAQRWEWTDRDPAASAKLPAVTQSKRLATPPADIANGLLHIAHSYVVLGGQRVRKDTRTHQDRYLAIDPVTCSLLAAHVPDQVHLKVEFEIEDDGTELEIELTW